MAFSQQLFNNLDEAEAFLKQNLNIILNVSPDQLNGLQVASPSPSPINSPYSDNSSLFLSKKQSFEGDLTRRNEFTPSYTLNGGSTSTSTFNLVGYANFLKNQLNALDSPRGISFIFSQTALHLLNHDVGVLYNPLSVFGPPPFFGGTTTETLDHPMADNIGTQNAIHEDRLMQLYAGKSIEVQRGITDFSVDGPKTILFNNQTFDQKYKELNLLSNDVSSGRQADKVKDFDPYDGTNTKTQKDILGVPQISPDYEKLFYKKQHGPGFSDSEKGPYGFFPRETLSELDSATIQAQKNISLIDSYFSKEDAENGFQDTSNNFDFSNADIYVPLTFQDLRKPERIISFRAFLTQFEESLAPTWNTEQFYGRVDPVGVYKNTSRTFSVGFKIVSFSQAGFSAMWKKINNLSKMVYPQVKNGAFFASPVIRLRIGDVCSDAAGRGLPGYINSALTFGYSDSTWETIPYIQQAANELGRAPMMADVNFTFQVIHEINPTIDENYNFDTTHFRRIGTLGQDVRNIASVDQNQPNTNDQTSNSANQTTTIPSSEQ